MFLLIIYFSLSCYQRDAFVILGSISNASSGFSYYASSTLLTSEFYQSLLDRGWRRSGTTLYKPDLRNACCPQYTIRLDSHSFHPSKDQRQVVNRFTKHILGNEYSKEAAKLYPKSREQAKKLNTEFDLLERIHEPEKQNIKLPPEPDHEFTVTLESNEYTEEKFKLFENYQRLVHKEPPYKITRSGFKSFLCTSPLLLSTAITNGKARRLGSYHQCYRLDGKLIAIGVLDLLPQCVSAVYFIYHESVNQHGFGKLGAMREIALAREEGYKWWYAGFYIHSCVKMRYKGDYSPQYMLDPETFKWHTLDDEMKKKLDETPYFSLSTDQEMNGPTTASFESSDLTMDDILPLPKKQSQSQEKDIFDVPSDDEPDESNTSLFSRNMPGIMPKSDLLIDGLLDHIKIRVRGVTAETSNLEIWDEDSIDDGYGIKGTIAELVAAVGEELAKEMIVHFG
jgi:arginine-tRNA-protein transferase